MSVMHKKPAKHIKSIELCDFFVVTLCFTSTWNKQFVFFWLFPVFPLRRINLSASSFRRVCCSLILASRVCPFSCFSLCSWLFELVAWLCKRSVVALLQFKGGTLLTENAAAVLSCRYKDAFKVWQKFLFVLFELKWLNRRRDSARRTIKRLRGREKRARKWNSTQGGKK